MEIDPEAVEKLKVTMSDFRHALANDVKPVRTSNSWNASMTFKIHVSIIIESCTINW